MGAKISGIGSNLLVIEGVGYSRQATEHRMLPDMIEIGSFIGLAAMTQSDITIKNVSLENLGVIPEKFKQLGIKMDFIGDDIHVPAQEMYEIQTFPGRFCTYSVRSSLAGLYARPDQYCTGNSHAGKGQRTHSPEDV